MHIFDCFTLGALQIVSTSFSLLPSIKFPTSSLASIPSPPNHTNKQTLRETEKKKRQHPNLTNHHVSYKRGCVLSLSSIILFYVNSLTSASPPLRDRTLVLPPNRPLEDFPTPIISLGRWPLRLQRRSIYLQVTDFSTFFLFFSDVCVSSSWRNLIPPRV